MGRNCRMQRIRDRVRKNFCCRLDCLGDFENQNTEESEPLEGRESFAFNTNTASDKVGGQWAVGTYPKDRIWQTEEIGSRGQELEGVMPDKRR